MADEARWPQIFESSFLMFFHSFFNPTILVLYRLLFASKTPFPSSIRWSAAILAFHSSIVSAPW
jgi:hypothetical protein